MKFSKHTTNRGFLLLQFHDANNELCDMQESSSIEEPHIWLGPHNANPKILANKLFPNKTGWVEYPIPKDVLINTRMHLNKKTMHPFRIQIAYLWIIWQTKIKQKYTGDLMELNIKGGRDSEYDKK